MKSRSRNELEAEIYRVEKALDKTDSVHLKKEYSTYLKRLKKQLKEVQKNDD